MKALTPKEKSVLDFIGKGFSTRQIALELNISYNTVQTHRRSLLKKFDANNSAQLIRMSLTPDLNGNEPNQLNHVK
jgi:DNA-binding CsgD family transcriptional regulator